MMRGRRRERWCGGLLLLSRKGQTPTVPLTRVHVRVQCSYAVSLLWQARMYICRDPVRLYTVRPSPNEAETHAHTVSRDDASPPSYFPPPIALVLIHPAFPLPSFDTPLPLPSRSELQSSRGT